MKTVQLVVLFSLSICNLFLNATITSAQPLGNTYDIPLAYVGVDGNYYVTSLDGTDATTITSYTPFDPGDVMQPPRYGIGPRWSPQGTSFLFSDNGLYKLESGKTPELLATSGWGTTAWSPDGNEIASFLGDLDIADDLRIIRANGTPVNNITLLTRPPCR